MAFCKNCGNQIPDGAAFCNSCGTPVQAQAQAQPQPQAQPQQNPAYANMTPEQADVQQNKVMAVLAYFGILALIPLFAAKNSKYARFHTGQGINLALCSIAYSIVTAIINAIVGAIAPGELKFSYFSGYYYAPSTLATIVSIILGLGSIVFLVFMIMGIVNACKGKTEKLPLFSQIPFGEMIVNAVNKNNPLV